MLTRSTGTILTIMRRLCVFLPPAAKEIMQEPRNLDLLMRSLLHLTQLPICLKGRRGRKGQIGADICTSCWDERKP